MILKIGLTGGIGSGKTTVARIFEILGIPVYYADREAKRMMQENPDTRKKIKDLLGEPSYIQGNLNTNFIASLVFKEPELLKALNKIVHPAVRNDFFNWADKYTGQAYVIEEAALLFDTGHYADFDYNILVFADKEIRIRRITRRDEIGRDEIMERMKNQLPEEDKVALSDFIIRNNEDDLILERVLELHNKFISLHKNNIDG